MGGYGELQRSCDEVFAELAARLPELHAEVRRLGADLREVVSEGRGEAVGAGATDAGATRGVVDDVKADSGQWAGHLAEGASGLAKIAAGLGPVLKIANNIRLMALNASFAAAACGDEARALDVLTRFLGGLASEFQVQARRLRDTAAGIDEELARVEAVRTEVDERLGRALGEQLDRVGRLAGELDAVVRAAFDEVAAAAGESDAFGPPVARLMEAIQREDIVRQGMDHVLLLAREMEAAEGVMADVEPGPGTPSEALEPVVFVERAGALTARLVENIDGDLAALVAEVGDSLAELGKLSGSFTAMAHRLVTSLDLEEDLDRMVRELGEGLEAARAEARAVERYEAAFEAIEGGADAIARGVQDFEGLLTELRLTNTMMKIEIGRSPALARAANLTVSIGEAVEDFVRFVSGFRGDIAGVSGPLRAAKASAAALSASSEARFRVIGASFERAGAVLQERAAGLSSRVAEVSAVAERVGRIVREVEGSVRGLEARLELQADLAASARQASASAAALLASADPAASSRVDRAAVDARLSEITERLTVLVHEEVAHDGVG